MDTRRSMACSLVLVAALSLSAAEEEAWKVDDPHAPTDTLAFDATEGVTEVTVSFTHIRNHDKAMLVGAGSSMFVDAVSAASGKGTAAD